MKVTYIIAVAAFALTVCAIAFLSEPDETTRVALYLDNHQLKEAEELLRQQYQKKPDNLDIAKKLVETLRELKEFPDARKIAQEVLQRYPDNIKWKRELAYIFLAEKDPDSAEHTLAPNERDPAFWQALAELYHDLSREDLAEKALFAAHENEEDKTALWLTLAKWRAERNNLAGEKEALEAALSIRPNDTGLLGSYFKNRAKAGDLKAALWASEKLPRPLDREVLEALFRLHSAKNDYSSAQKVAEQLVARSDTRPADSLALASSLYLQNKFAEARTVLDKLVGQAADYAPSVKEAIFSQTKAVRIATLLQGAENGNEQPLLNEINNLRRGKSESDPDILRQLLYACLKLSDFFSNLAKNISMSGGSPAQSETARKRAQFWLDEAQSIFAENWKELPLALSANARIAADLAERRGDWTAMLNAWNILASQEKPDFNVFLGLARASQNLHDYESSWQSLMRAEGLARDDRELLEIALQAQNLASLLPVNDSHRKEKIRFADDLARKSLAKNWDGNLALNLFFRMLEAKKLNEADELLQALASKGLATTSEYLGLAEAQIEDLRLPVAGNKAARKSAFHNAKKALEKASPDMLPRLLYIFMRLNKKQDVEEILQRFDHEKPPQSPLLLRQLADAYAYIGNQKRQLALLEQLARTTGKLADWEELIDQYYWHGDQQRALELLDHAESLFPANGNLLSRHLMALVNMGRHKEAIKYFQKFKDHDQDIENKISAESLGALGHAYDASGYYDRAYHFYKQSLTKNPANESAALGMAELLRREGRDDKASHLLGTVIKRDPSNIWAREQLAELKPSQGKRQYESILDNKKQEGFAEKAVRALALRKTGHIKQALHLYAELMKDPNRTQAIMRDYAQALMAADDLEEAKKVLLEAVDEFPKDIQAKRLLAAVFIRQKRYGEAESCLRQALKLAPGNTEISRDLAYVQQAQKKFWSAQKNYRAGGNR